jgi:hypothetical protein
LELSPEHLGGWISGMLSIATVIGAYVLIEVASIQAKAFADDIRKNGL